MNELQRIFYETEHKPSQKVAHYFDIYERYFSRYRGNADLKLLEIGVERGGSLDMWRSYFGPEALIIGVDVTDWCKGFEAGKTLIRIGKQEDPRFLQSLINEFGSLDIVIDDGGHTMHQQITAFRYLYPIVRGIYLVEDCLTSYDAKYGGGLRQPNTFIEFAKAKVDELNGFNNGLVNEFTRTTTSIGFFDSLVVFEKGMHNKLARVWS